MDCFYLPPFSIALSGAISRFESFFKFCTKEIRNIVKIANILVSASYMPDTVLCFKNSSSLNSYNSGRYTTFTPFYGSGNQRKLNNSQRASKW